MSSLSASNPLNPSGPDSVGTVSDVTCLGCGCLCDDIEVTTLGGKIVEPKHACEIGRYWFLADQTRENVPEATLKGQPVQVEQALSQAADLLRQSKSPLFVGLTSVSNETVAAALALADRLGATVNIGSGPEPEQALRAVQRVGRVSATLGEVKNRADVVVFCGVNPLVTHPRHWERYSVEPQGRFVPQGRAGRSVLVLDSVRTASAEKADEFFQVDPTAWFETLLALRGLIKGTPFDARRVECATGLGLPVLNDLAQRLKQARYGAWFIDSQKLARAGGSATVEAALTLVRDLNRWTRFVILEMGYPGNPNGASAVQTWQTGFASSVSFASGVPQSIPSVTSSATLLEQSAVDLVVCVGEPLPPGLPANVPTILIAPKATVQASAVTVAFDSTTSGIDSGGTVIRTDGVSLPLRPPLQSSRLSPQALLEEMTRRLKTSEDLLA